MDGFALVAVGGLLFLFLVFLAIGKWYPGSGAEQLDWKPTRSVETEVELELDDIDQMLEAQNERRRRRGRRPPPPAPGGRGGRAGRRPAGAGRAPPPPPPPPPGGGG